jgi:hypothetical protein
MAQAAEIFYWVSVASVAICALIIALACIGGDGE